jgi:regulator of protease activity HflC (stomatin/prohibitin superfamily)
VNLYGSNKGVDDVELVTGMVWYNPFTTSVYEYPTFVQTIDYEPFEFNSKDGSVFSFDPKVMMNLKPNTAAEVFKKYRKDMDEILTVTLVTIIQDAFKEEINVRTDNELISDQTSFQNAIEERLKAELGNENFIVTKVSTGIKYPDALVKAINDKNVAIQKKAEVENQVAVAEAEAKKKIIEAQAEKEANELRTVALTPAVLQQMWIEKWDGTVPTVITNGNSSTFIDLSKIGK